MATWYREIEAQKPFPFNKDKNNRIMFSVNLRAICAPTAEWEKEIAQILIDAGVVTKGVDLFSGPDAPIPNGQGPYLTLNNTGGPEGERTHNSVDVPAYERPTMQLIIRAGDDTSRTPPGGYDAGLAMATAAYLALVGVRNTTITAV